ncbi:MAG: hypothetical protein AAB553_05655 [Patescibacteria group bacterium]
MDTFEEGIENIARSSGQAAKQAAKQTVSDAAAQAANPQDWLNALYGPSDPSPSADQASDQGTNEQATSTAQNPLSQIPDQRTGGDQGEQSPEDIQAKRQQEQKKEKEHYDRHMTTYWEPLFGKARRERMKQEEEQKKQEEEHEEKQEKKMEELEKKEKTEKLPITRARNKAESGIGNAGG